MGIAYAPFEDMGEPKPPVYDPLRIETIKTVVRQPEADATECNYLVMFFVIGIFALALSDAGESGK
jgi:hypothetical protein